MRLEQVGSVVQLTVADNGAGIAPDFLPHVFERFRQADQTMTRSYGGLGLGLSIVKHLVELHGGTVAAESAGLGQGSSFTITIPISAVRHSTPDAEPGERTTPEVLRELEGLRVLVVDDEADARDLMAEILSNEGVNVRTARDAESALFELAAFVPEVLVCDIGMPGQDGFALMQRVRTLAPEQGGRVRAAAVTAYARGEDRRRALAAGFNVHLAKPVDPHELVVTVARLADRYPS